MFTFLSPEKLQRNYVIDNLQYIHVLTPFQKECRFLLSDTLFDHPSYSIFLYKYHLFCYDLFYHWRYFNNDLFILLFI